MTTESKQSGTVPVSATPELAQFIGDLLASAALPATATLADLRDMLLSSDLFISGDAELIYRLDRTAIVIEVDALIDSRGDETRLEILLAA